MAAGILTSLDAIAGKTLKVDTTALNEDDSGEINIGYYEGATIVLFSDGEDTSETDPLTYARLASVAGVRIQTIGVGTVAGTAVQIDGFSVATALDPQTLEAVAEGHQRRLPPGRRSGGPERRLQHDQPALHGRDRDTPRSPRSSRRLPSLLLAVGALLSVLWFGRVM